MTLGSGTNRDLLESGLPPANDRMLTTCFLAAVFHGVLILGVTFSASRTAAGGPEAPALEVVLVGDQAPRTAENSSAQYVAQRTQRGSGNAAEGQTTLIPRSSPVPVDRAGMPDGAGDAWRQLTADTGTDALIATATPAVKVLYFAAPMAGEQPTQAALLLEKRPDLGMTPNDDGIELRMRGAARDQLWVAADTRASDVAVYLDGWRRKIERVGTLNFPDVARRRHWTGTPVIEVTIGADGRLVNTLLRRSSGHPEIDAAAIRILKLAAPYDPFPSALNLTHDQIRIAYEWQFLGGAAAGSSVLYNEPGAAGGAP